MEIAVRDLPKCIRSFSFSPRAVYSDVDNINFLVETKEYMFGIKCCEAAEKLDIDLFDLVFVNEKTFGECFDAVIKKRDIENIDVLKTAFMMKRMYSGDHVQISRIIIKGDIAYVTEPEYSYINIIGENSERPSDRKRRKEEKKAQKKIELNNRAKVVLESVKLRALKYSMEKCVSNKELIDKYNVRRFSTNLRLNYRPAGLDEINAAMALKKDRMFADFSKEKTRINFSVLYSIAYGGYTLKDIYSKNTVFEANSGSKEKRLSDLSSELLTILYNGNGIEISNMMINIIVKFTQTELPPVDLNDLDVIIENYPVYYAVANLAAICENIFKFDSGNHTNMREYLNTHTFLNYWTVLDRLMFMKQYSDVVSFCYRLSTFDMELYRDDPEYQGSVLYSFESAEKFAEELKKIE